MKENTRLLNNAEIRIPNSYCAKCGAYGTTYRLCKCAARCDRCCRGAVDEANNGKDEETTDISVKTIKCKTCNTEFLHDEEEVKSCNSTAIYTAVCCVMLQLAFAATVIGGYNVSSAQLNGMGGMCKAGICDAGILLILGFLAIMLIAIFTYTMVFAFCMDSDIRVKLTHKRLILLHVAMLCLAIAAQIVGCMAFRISYGDGRPNIYTFGYGIVRVCAVLAGAALIGVIAVYGRRVFIGMTVIEKTEDVYVFEK